MYLDTLVNIPRVSGKIVFRKQDKNIYIYYETGRKYNPIKQQTKPKRVLIGKQAQGDTFRMFPNQNYFKWFLSKQRALYDVRADGKVYLIIHEKKANKRLLNALELAVNDNPKVLYSLKDIYTKYKRINDALLLVLNEREKNTDLTEIEFDPQFPDLIIEVIFDQDTENSISLAYKALNELAQTAFRLMSDSITQ